MHLKRLKKKGLEYEGEYLKLYEANLPPLLRYFHIRDISPSGWITFKKAVAKTRKKFMKICCACFWLSKELHSFSIGVDCSPAMLEPPAVARNRKNFDENMLCLFWLSKEPHCFSIEVDYGPSR